MAKYERREPCGNCPFRKDAPLAYWDPREYLMLAENERIEGDIMQAESFGCHKDRQVAPEDRQPCVGWLIHQREHGVPNLRLRHRLITSEQAAAQFTEARLPEGVELYDSINELVESNIQHDRVLHPERYGDDA